MHSVFTLDIATLIHLSISYLVSSLPSSWIINSSASTHMTGKSTIFFTFHLSSAPSVVFADGSFKHSISTVNLTFSLALTNVNYIPHVSFNLVSVSSLIKAFQCSLTFSPSSCTVQDIKMKVISEGYEQDGLYYLHAVINLK